MLAATLQRMAEMADALDETSEGRRLASASREHESRSSKPTVV